MLNSLQVHSEHEIPSHEDRLVPPYRKSQDNRATHASCLSGVICRSSEHEGYKMEGNRVRYWSGADLLTYRTSFKTRSQADLGRMNCPLPYSTILTSQDLLLLMTWFGLAHDQSRYRRWQHFPSEHGNWCLLGIMDRSPICRLDV